MCLWGNWQGRSDLALLRTLSGPCSTRYGGSCFIPHSPQLVFSFPEFMHLYLFHDFKNVVQKETKRNYSNWGVFMGAEGSCCSGPWSCTHTLCCESCHMMKAGFQRHLPYYPTSASKTERRKGNKPLRLACPQQRLRGFSEAQMCGSYGYLDWLLMEFICTTGKKRLFWNLNYFFKKSWTEDKGDGSLLLLKGTSAFQFLIEWM